MEENISQKEKEKAEEEMIEQAFQELLNDYLATKHRKRVEFEELFTDATSRFDLVITFLALLEMSKLRITRLFQTEPLAPLYVEATGIEADLPEQLTSEDPGAP